MVFVYEILCAFIELSRYQVSYEHQRKSTQNTLLGHTVSWRMLSSFHHYATTISEIAYKVQGNHCKVLCYCNIVMNTGRFFYKYS